jgi:sec-independent protein translocase protein TatA
MFEGLFQPLHLLIIFAIALILFGPKRLPELGKGIGEGIRSLKEGMKDNKDNSATKTDTSPEKTPENKS